MLKYYVSAVLMVLAASAASHALTVVPGSVLASTYLEKLENPRFDTGLGKMCDWQSVTFTFRGDSEGRTRTVLKQKLSLNCGMAIVSGNKIVAGDQWAFDPLTQTLGVLEYTGIREGEQVTVHFGIKQ